MNSIVIAELGEKEKAENVKYWFDLTGDSAFTGSSPETLNANAAWYLTTVDAPSTNIPSMIAANDYDDTLKRIAVQITGGTTGTSYYVKGKLTVSSGRIYVVVGKVKIVDKGVQVI